MGSVSTGYTLSEASFTGPRGFELYTRKYIPNDDAYDTVLLFCHGVGEHCTRYDPLFATLASKRIAVYALDHQGHGKSSGNRHDCLSFGEFIDDIAAFDAIIRKDHASMPNVRYVVGGISFGGLLAAVTAATTPDSWHGLMLFAPAIGVDMNFTLKVQQSFAGILEVVAPTWTIVPAVNPKLLSRNKSFVEDYEADALNDHRKMKVRLALNISRGMKQLEHIQDKIRMPVVVFHGDKDQVTSPTISKVFFDGLQATDKKYVSLSGQYHCLLNEPEKDDTIDMAVQWITQLKSH